jgi:hypothetical protein
MPKRPARKFKASKEARRVARETIGIPPAQKVVPDKRRRPPKHKKTARELIEQS